MTKSIASAPPKNGAPVFAVREKLLMSELGLSRDDLRARCRQLLIEGAHWINAQRQVFFSDLGAEILRATKSLQLPAPPPPPPAPAPVTPRALLLAQNPQPVEFHGELIAWHSPRKNERLLIAYIPGADPTNPRDLVNVLVRSNRNFIRGMSLKAYYVGDNRYELIGPCPRWRGRF